MKDVDSTMMNEIPVWKWVYFCEYGKGNNSPGKYVLEQIVGLGTALVMVF